MFAQASHARVQVEQLTVRLDALTQQLQAARAGAVAIHAEAERVTELEGERERLEEEMQKVDELQSHRMLLFVDSLPVWLLCRRFACCTLHYVGTGIALKQICPHTEVCCTGDGSCRV
jgi:hypothetical protein